MTCPFLINETSVPGSTCSTEKMKHLPVLKLLDCALRLCVIPLSVATIWLSVTNQQDESSYGKLGFKNLTGLKYMVCISAIGAGYCFITAVYSCLKCLVSMCRAWVLFGSDQVIAYLMVTSGAAVMEILYLGYNGDREVTWSEACTSFGKVCSRMKVALVLHGLALCCFLVLAVISAYRVFCMFEAPTPAASAEEEK